MGAQVRRLRARARRYKLAASALIALPLALLLLLAGGEMAGGEITGIQHIITAVPLAALVVLGWKRPQLAAVLLVAAGSIVLLAWIILVASADFGRGEIAVFALAGLLLFAPPLLAGWLFWRAGRLLATA